MVSHGLVELHKFLYFFVSLTFWLDSAISLELYSGKTSTNAYNNSLGPPWTVSARAISPRVHGPHSSNCSRAAVNGRRLGSTSFGAFLACPTICSRDEAKPLSATTQFNFDPELVKKRRHNSLGQKNGRPKKLEADHETMHDMANLMSDHPTKEDLRAISLQEFISKIERRPQRKRIPPPAGAYDPSYDAIMYLKGLPYEVKDDDVRSWLSDYDIVYVVLIKNENGCFTGDAYVRCGSIAERDRMHREMSNKSMGVRYIQMFRLTESAYIEYYNTGFRREPAKRNFISPSVLIVKHNTRIDPLHVATLKTGSRVCGAVSEIYRNGLLLDCGVYEVLDGLKERVFCVLMRNRIAKNVGIRGQQKEWLRRKDLVLFPGIKLNLYVEKVRKTTAQTSFDEDLWREHFGEPFESLNHDAELAKRSMVYLTMDSSVSEDKVKWWERRLVDSYAKFTLKEDQPIETVEHDEIFQKIAVGVDWLGGRPEIKSGELVAGRVTLVGNKKLTEKTSTFTLEQEEPTEVAEDDGKSYHDLIREFMRGSDVDKHGTHYYGFDEPGGYKEDDEYAKTPKKSSHAIEDASFDEGVYHVPEEQVVSASPMRLDAVEDARRRTIAEEFKAFPRTTLFDECIQLPIGGWLLRRSDVPNLSAPQVRSILRQLGKCPVEDGDNADFDNRMLLCQVIKEEGLGSGLDPKTLIAKGLYKVNQSKKKMKRVIELTKNLTGRKFTREDLDAATKSELRMLADESLKKFSEWNPPDPVKRAFVDMYGSVLGDAHRESGVNEKWEALKWHIVVEIYGEQNHLKEIIQDMEANDRMLGNQPESSRESIERLIQTTIEKTPAIHAVTTEPPKD
ncbi:hypothetical protein X943_001913 [Babesia divergens]|uniref:RRM domain-containing protein n=1 Tax=Babesia divergens TaxID=32595 RepID=A0AAD9LE60_BABDI|nr:hypothetical protein X943_001913 [Babesia divergens]